MTITLVENDNVILKKAFEALSEIYIFDIRYKIRKRIVNNYEYMYFLEEV